MTIEERKNREYEKLVSHVNNYYFVKYRRIKKYWEVGCWLGKKPPRRLFKIEMTEANKLNETLEQLAKNMYEFLLNN